MTDPNQLLENWEKDFENLAASLLLQGINIRHIAKFKLSFEEYVKKLLKQQEAKTREEERSRISKIIEDRLPGIILDNIDYWVMLRDLDGQYHQVFNEMSYKVMEEAQQQILDLNGKKDD